MLKLRPILLTCTAALLAVACNSADENVGSIHVKSADIEAALGGQIEVTAEDYAPFAGTRLIIPKDALAADTRITIGIGPESIIDTDGDAAGLAVEFGPAGTQFAHPVEVRIPITETVNEDLIRVYVENADGTREVILPNEIEIEAGHVRFFVSHFTSYQPGRARGACRHVMCPSGQCRRGQCNSPCTANECGPQPGVPSWTCEDGSPGGSTGVCERSANGVCGWQIIWCERICDPEECGPAPGAPNYMCPDGSVGGPFCERNDAGTCGWDNRTCEGEGCTDDFMCEPGSFCDPSTDQCVPDICTLVDCQEGFTCVPEVGACVPDQPEQCGSTTCASGTYCCNASCGICAPLDGACTQQACAATCGGPMDPDCPAGFSCDPNGICVEDGVACGSNTCYGNTECCNASCGTCVPPGFACTQEACASCDGINCGVGEVCDPVSLQCVPEVGDCLDSECGPQPGVPSWTCEDGTPGGSTGRCRRIPDGTCGWEIIWCEQACMDSECGAPPTDPAMTCSDGSIPSPRCSRPPPAMGQAQSCQWSYEPCP